MRILAVTNLFPSPLKPHFGTFNRHQFKALAAEHEVAVIAPISWTDERSARRHSDLLLPRERRLNWEGIPVEYPSYYYVPRYFRGWQGRTYRWSIRDCFRRAISSFRPDIVFATWAYPDGWAAVDLAHQVGLPAVLKVHGSDILLLEQFPSRRKGTVEALRRADQVIAVSQDLARKVIELGAQPDRVHLVYNGVDATVFRSGSREEARKRLGLTMEENVLLFVGNLLPVKGIDVLIDACGILKPLRDDFHLYIVGQGPLRTQVEQEIQRLGLNENVTFVGAVPNEKLPDWYRAAGILVLPSRSEGVPNVLLEAAACGCRFVASDVGGVKEVAHLGQGRLVPSQDPAKLAEAIDAHLTEPPTGPVAKPSARSHIDAARELVKVFDQAIANRAHAPRLPARPIGSRWRQLARRALLSVMPRRLFVVRGSQASRSICLTFDDGPHPELTPRLLDFLQSENVHATFFLIGREAEKYPELVRRMSAEGHAIGSHSYSHPHRTELSRAQMAEEVVRGKQTLDRILGQTTSLYRPPHGKVTARDLWWMWRNGLTVVLWNVDPRDYSSPSSEKVGQWFRDRKLGSGDVVLFHDTHPHALAVLPELVRSTRESGFTFATVRDWIK